MNYQKTGKTRLKLYIPESKFRSWDNYYEENDLNSEFRFNFSRWVRTACSVLPPSDLVPIYPVSNQTSGVDNSISGRREKTVWIPVAMKQALVLKKGHLSLNAYILLLLDMKVFGGMNKGVQISQMINLRRRIDDMELKLRQIEDQTYTKFH